MRHIVNIRNLQLIYVCVLTLYVVMNLLLSFLVIMHHSINAIASLTRLTTEHRDEMIYMSYLFVLFL